MDDQIALTGLIGTRTTAGPDDKDRGDGRQLPIDKQRDQIAGEGRADGGANISKGRRILQPVFTMERIDDADKGGDVEDVAENQRELVDPNMDKLQAKDRHRAKAASIQLCKLPDP